MSTHGSYNESSALLGEDFGASVSSGKFLHDELMDVPLHGSLANDKSNSAAPADSRASGTRDERASSSSSTGPLKPTLSVMPQTPLQSLNLRPELQVSVLAPEKATGINSLGLTTTFTTYLLQTKTTLPSFPEQMISVRRRFSDFDALYHVLRALYAGYFVPKLPEKDFVNGKMVVTDDFVERRAEELQVFITRACNHEVLHTSKALELFLTLDTDNLTQQGEWKRLETADSLFLSFRHLFSPISSHESGQESLEGARRSALAKLGDSVMLTFKKISDQVKAQIAPDMTQLVPEESRLRERGAQMQEAAYGYAALLMRWSRSMKALAGVSLVLAETGAEFSKMYNFEDRSFPKFGQFTPLGRSLALAAADYQKVAYHALSVGSACQRHVGVLEKAASPLRHVDSSLREGVTAYKDREQLYVASSELRIRLQEKRERYRVVSPEAGSPVSESQTAGLQHMLKEIKAMEEKLQELDKDYATVADINRQETQAAMESKDKLVPLAILQMAQTQQHLEEYSADRWQQLANALEEAAGS